MNTLSAYHGDATLKADLLAELALHRQADAIIKGQYAPSENGWKEFRGCAIGCSVQSLNTKRGTKINHNDHFALARALGVTPHMMRLEDCIFERLPNELAVQWPERFSTALKEGVDYGAVHIDFLIAVQERNIARLDASKWSGQINAIQKVLKVLRDWKAGNLDIDAAYSAADSAADSAARLADSACSARLAARSAYSAAYSAADSTAYSAAYSAYSVAYSAAYSARSAEEPDAECIWMADTLIKIIEYRAKPEPREGWALFFTDEKKALSYAERFPGEQVVRVREIIE